MSAKMMKANPNAEVNLLDLSPDMAVYAHENKVPNDHVHISDITQMKYGGKKPGDGVQVTSGSVSHVLSHSVIWILEDPNPFFAEVARVLKPGGRLSLTTLRTTEPSKIEAFLQGLRTDMDQALAKSIISKKLMKL